MPDLPAGPRLTIGTAASAAYHRARCVSTTSPGPRSRSGSTSCGRSPSGSSGSASPASAGARRGSPATAGSASYRDIRAFRDDPGREAVGASETTAALVHLRRPSRLSTLTIADTQPFDDPAGRFAFSHNGDLRDYKRLRATYRAAGPDPRPGRHRGRRALARGRLARRRARRAPARRAPRPVRRPGQPRRPQPRTERRITTPATTRTRSSRSGSGGSGSSRPGSTRSIGRSSGSRPRARPTAGSSGSRTTASLDRDGSADRRGVGWRRSFGSTRRHSRLRRRLSGDHAVTEPTDDRRPGATPASDPASGRPTTRLPNRELIRISLYWLGLSSIFAGLELHHRQPARVHRPRRQGRRRTRALPRLDQRRGHRDDRPADDRLDLATTRSRAGAGASRTSSSARSSTSSSSSGSPTATRSSRSPRSSPSSSSARTSPRARSRATSRTSCPAPQVGTASALVGLMQVLGIVVGLHDRRARGRRRTNYALGLIALGVLELATMLSVVIRVREGRPPKSREGRPWRSIAAEAWGTDILRERSFVWLVGLASLDPDGRIRPDQPRRLLPGPHDGPQRDRTGGRLHPARRARRARDRLVGRAGGAALRPGRPQARHLGELRGRRASGWRSSPAPRACRSRSSGRCCTASRPGCSSPSTGRS